MAHQLLRYYSQGKSTSLRQLLFCEKPRLLSNRGGKVAVVLLLTKWTEKMLIQNPLADSTAAEKGGRLFYHRKASTPRTMLTPLRCEAEDTPSCRQGGSA
jgi:hypothetical protein